MLSWEKGVKATDGPWTVRGWYDQVANSTAFKPYEEKEIVIFAEYEKFYAECEEVYQELRKFTL